MCLIFTLLSLFQHTCFEHKFLALLQSADSLLLFSAMLYECVTQECPEMLPTYIAIEQVTQTGIN